MKWGRCSRQIQTPVGASAQVRLMSQVPCERQLIKQSIWAAVRAYGAIQSMGARETWVLTTTPGSARWRRSFLTCTSRASTSVNPTQLDHLLPLIYSTVDCWDQLEDDLENIEFVLDDIKGRTRFPDNTFDLVHMRQMRLTVRCAG
jgi:hypothetical protein